MANKRYTAEYNITGNAEDALKGIETAARGAEKETSKLDGSTKKASDSSGKQTQSLKKLGAGFAALAAAITVVIAKYYEQLKAWAQTEAALGRLSRQIKKAGAGQYELEKATEMLRKTSARYGIELAENADAYRRLVSATDDVTKATSDYQLALDIASQEGIAVSQAAEAIAKARKGEFEELKRLDSFNKSYVEDLVRMEDRAGATEQAIRRLTDAYDGAAEANRGLEERMSGAEESFKQIKDELVGIVFQIFELQNHPLTDAFGEDGFLADVAIGLEKINDGLEKSAAITNALRKGDLEKALEVARSISEEAAPAEPVPTYDGPIYGADVDVENLKKIGDKVRKQNEKDAREKAQRAKAAAAERARMEREAAAAGEGAAGGVLASIEEAQAQKEKADELQREIDLRNMIAQLRLEGHDLEASLIEIERSKLTSKEQELAAHEAITRELADQQAIADEQAAKAKENQQAIARAKMQEVSAYASGAKEIIGLFGDEEKAKRAQALLDGAVFTYKAQAAFFDPLLGGPAGAVALAGAAAGAFAVAGGAGGGSVAKKGGAGGSAGGGGPTNTPEAAARQSARILAEELNKDSGPRGTTINVNYRGIARPTEQEGRVLGETIRREAQLQVGGAGRSLNIGGG